MKKVFDINADLEESIRSVSEDRNVKYLNKIVEDCLITEKEYQDDQFPLSRVFDNYEWDQITISFEGSIPQIL